MSITANMGLTAWDLGTDFYNFTQLASNFVAIDGHTHEPGKGPQIPTAGIVNGAVVAAKIADATLTSTKYGPASVIQAALAKPSVGTPELFDGSVTGAKIASGSITSDKIDSTFVPIGECIMWLRADVTVPIPGGFWEPLDGRAWSSVTNLMGPGGTQLNTGTMPDTRNAFILGAATSGTGSGPSTPPAIGSAGGSMTYGFNHSHSVAGHTHTTLDHTHTMQDHNHAIAGDGAHNHGVYSRQTRTLPQDQTGNDSYLQTLYVAGFNSGGGNALIPLGGAHSHGGGTGPVAVGSLTSSGASTGASTTSSNGSTTDSQLSSSFDIRPKFVGFLILCRVR